LEIEWRPHPDGARPESYLLRVDPGAFEDTLDHDSYAMATGVQTHTITSLQPGVEYTVRLQAVGVAGVSVEAVLTHRTEHEVVPVSGSSPYDVHELLHCGMGSSEEVQPAGPPPEGASFFPGMADVESCRARCDDNRQCVAFQVKVGDACWLYRRRPSEQRVLGPRIDQGWWCGMRRTEF